jgi:hypothetical protein
MWRLHDRKGRALLKLGLFSPAEESFSRLLETAWESISSSSSAAASASSSCPDEDTREEAKLNLKQIKQAEIALERLAAMDSNMNDFNVKIYHQLADQLIQTSPYFREAQCFKAKSLCHAHKWNDAKLFMEESICLVHKSILELNAHEAAQYPSPTLRQVID